MAVLGLAWDSLQVLILHIFFKVIFGCVQAFSSCGKQGLFSSCGARAGHVSGFSCCVVEHRL